MSCNVFAFLDLSDNFPVFMICHAVLPVFPYSDFRYRVDLARQLEIWNLIPRWWFFFFSKLNTHYQRSMCLKASNWECCNKLCMCLSKIRCLYCVVLDFFMLYLFFFLYFNQHLCHLQSVIVVILEIHILVYHENLHVMNLIPESLQVILIVVQLKQQIP